MPAGGVIEARSFFRPPTEELRHLPECPRVLRNPGQPGTHLGWVAIQHGTGIPEGSFNLLALDTRTNVSFPLPGRPGFFVETDQPGVLLVGLERRLILLDLATGRPRETGMAVCDDERVIINDGIAIPDGLLFGTKHLEFNQTIAALYHYDCRTRQVRTLVGEQICSNGKHFQVTADAITLIDIDSLPRTITHYRFDRGLERIDSRRLIVPVDTLPSLPDGLRASPAEDSIVVAFYNPAPVEAGVAQEIRIADGAVLTEWILPGSPRVTCPEFVPIDGRVCLLFTTAVEGMSEADQARAPRAGEFFIAPTRFTAMPAPPPLFPIAGLP